MDPSALGRMESQDQPVFRRRKRKPKTKMDRFRKKLSTYLHTHVALILLSVLVVMDAACVIGQILCDILIIKESLIHHDATAKDLVGVLKQTFPKELNETASDASLTHILDILQEMLDEQENEVFNGFGLRQARRAPGSIKASNNGQARLHTLEETGGVDSSRLGVLFLSEKRDVLDRVRRSLKVRPYAAGDSHEEEHDILHELTHAFHLASLTILSLLVTETLLKLFAMGRKLLHHKLEIFDAFVVIVSWSLDVAFHEGIWAQPGSEAATILLFLLPWRVIRIVNSFLLVIQEKDHVRLKLVKQRYRRSERRVTECKQKLNGYRVETKSLQGLSRKYGAKETEIVACAPNGKRRRSSLPNALCEFASLALISAVGNTPDKSFANDYSSSDSSDDETSTSSGSKVNGKLPSVRTISMDSGMSFSLSPDPMDNPVFVDDEAVQANGANAESAGGNINHLAGSGRSQTHLITDNQSVRL